MHTPPTASAARSLPRMSWRYPFSSLILPSPLARVILALAVLTLTGCDIFGHKIREAPPAATPKIQQAQKVVADVTTTVTDAAAQIQSEAEAIDGAAESVAPDIRVAISEHTKAIMDEVAKVKVSAQRLSVEAVPALTAAQKASEDQAAEVKRARESEAAAIKAKNDAEHDKLVGWSVMAICLGAVGIGVGLFVLHSMTAVGFGGALMLAGFLIGGVARLIAIPWILPVAGLAVVAGVGVGLWLLWSGRLSKASVFGGAKLLSEAASPGIDAIAAKAKVLEATAALRVNTEVTRALRWINKQKANKGKPQ